MKSAPFSYHAPASLDEATDLLVELGGDGGTRALAGGQSLLPLMHLRKMRPRHVIDLNRVAGLDAVQQIEGQLRIGAMVRQSTAERLPLVRDGCPLLVEALDWVGTPQIRNRGTVGGSVAHGDPRGEIPAVAVALDAQIVVRDSRRSRTLTADAFFTGPFATALAPDELVVEIRIPWRGASIGWSFQEVALQRRGPAVVAAAAVVELGPRGEIAEARLALSGVALTAIRRHSAEELLRGEMPSVALFAAASERSAEHLVASSDVFASAEYRRHLAWLLTGRALRVCVERAAQ